MAQRRLRALGMLSAIGATERNLRLVMIANGLAVGVAGALAGAVLGFAAWFAYVPTLQQATGHVVDAAQPAVVGVRHRGRARDRDVGAGVPPPGQDDGPGAGGGRAVRPPRAAEGGAPLRPARRHRVRGRRRVPGDRRRAGRGKRQRGQSRAAPARRPGRRDHRHRPARPAGHQRAAGQPPGCRSRSGSRCATWSATGPGPVPRWRRPRSPCSWPWGSASSPASSSRTSSAGPAPTCPAAS